VINVPFQRFPLAFLLSWSGPSYLQPIKAYAKKKRKKEKSWKNDQDLYMFLVLNSPINQLTSLILLLYTEPYLPSSHKSDEDIQVWWLVSIIPATWEA
jgi:hypothetical protein